MSLYDQLADQAIDAHLNQLDGYSENALIDMTTELADDLRETVYQFVHDKARALEPEGPDPDYLREQLQHDIEVLSRAALTPAPEARRAA